ncbi:hypothetical protein LZ30DRAFT_611343 [Colletotrichum cereale]|nr:hypothetical protein LZ30DRAFT_611343 [Colletotrichum cereale]
MRSNVLPLLSLFSWSLILLSAQVWAIVTERDYNLKFDRAYYVSEGSELACTEDQLNRIKTGISSAQDLANKAILLLETKGFHSNAFIRWFGQGNANPQTVKALLNQHYKIAFSALPRPRIPVGLKSTTFTRRARFKVAAGELKPTDDSLVYACPPLSQTNRGYCTSRNGHETGAFVLDPWRTRWTKTAIIGLCPAFFTAPTSIMAQILLHEIQHLYRVTFPSPAATDVIGPGTKTRCYSAQCCQSLPDAQKIQNAQNFAYFALEAGGWNDF